MKLDEIKARNEEREKLENLATPGEWHVMHGGFGKSKQTHVSSVYFTGNELLYIARFGDCYHMNLGLDRHSPSADADFVAFCRNHPPSADISFLLGEVERLNRVMKFARQEYRSAIVTALVIGRANKIGGNPAGEKSINDQLQTLIAFGANSGLVSVDEASHWLDVVYERNGKTVQTAIEQYCDQTANP